MPVHTANRTSVDVPARKCTIYFFVVLPVSCTLNLVLGEVATASAGGGCLFGVISRCGCMWCTPDRAVPNPSLRVAARLLDRAHALMVHTCTCRFVLTPYFNAYIAASVSNSKTGLAAMNHECCTVHTAQPLIDKHFRRCTLGSWGTFSLCVDTRFCDCMFAVSTRSIHVRPSRT